jgi:NADH-quinone oxidoreductase subunit N
MSYFELLRLLGPEVCVVLAMLAVLLVDLTILRGQRRRCGAGSRQHRVSGLSGGRRGHSQRPRRGPCAGWHVRRGRLSQIVKLVLLVMAFLTVLLSVEGDFTGHIGEHIALLLLATTGMMLMVGAEDRLMIFLALELTSLSLYALVALRKESAASVEAGLKYFFFGAMAAAFALFGFSLLYGMSGATGLADIAASLRGRGFDPLFGLAMLMVVVGFGFKVAAVPFHLWAPDAYQGAPTPAAALVASDRRSLASCCWRVLVLAFPEQAGDASLARFGPAGCRSWQDWRWPRWCWGPGSARAAGRSGCWRTRRLLMPVTCYWAYWRWRMAVEGLRPLRRWCITRRRMA